MGKGQKVKHQTHHSSPSDKPTGEVTDAVAPDDFGGCSTDGLSSSSLSGRLTETSASSVSTCYPGTSNSHPAFSDTTKPHFSPIFTNRDPSEKNLMSPSDKPTGEVTDAHVDSGLAWVGVSCAICGYDRDYGG